MKFCVFCALLLVAIDVTKSNPTFIVSSFDDVTESNTTKVTLNNDVNEILSRNDIRHTKRNTVLEPYQETGLQKLRLKREEEEEEASEMFDLAAPMFDLGPRRLIALQVFGHVCLVYLYEWYKNSRGVNLSIGGIFRPFTFPFVVFWRIIKSISKYLIKLLLNYAFGDNAEMIQAAMSFFLNSSGNFV